jgi:hypothetical protein
MNRTATIILVVIFAALIGLALWLNRPQEAAPVVTTGTVTPTLGPLWSFTSVDITEIRFEDLENTEGDTPALEMRKDTEGQWILYGMLPGDSRLSREANQETVESFVNQLVLLTPSSDLGEDLDLPTFGLDGSGFRLTVTTATGTTNVLEISRDTTPTGKGYYTKMDGSQRVYVVPTSTINQLFTFLGSQPVLATVTPMPPTATPEATEAGTNVLPEATATSAP